LIGSRCTNRGNAPKGRPYIVGVCVKALSGFLIGAAWSAATVAAEWSVQPSVGASVGRDSNPLLVTGSHESATVESVSPGMRIRGKTELSELDLGLALDFQHYSTDQIKDADHQILSFKSFSRTSERTRFGLDGEFRRDDLRQTVEGVVPVGGVGDSDVGLVQTDVTRTRRNLRPVWTQNITERSSVQLSYGYTDVDFKNAAGTGLVDYTDQNVAFSFSRSITPRDSLSITTSGSQYRASSVDNKTDTTRLLVGYARTYSETSNVSIAVGASNTKQEFGSTVDRSSGSLFEASAREFSETIQLEGTISRDVSPSGLGRSIRSDQLRLRLIRGLSQKYLLSVRANLLKNSLLEGTDPTVDRRYYEAEIGLGYQWNSQWLLRTSYLYRYQRFDVDPSAATSGAVYVGVAYNWRPQFFGR